MERVVLRDRGFTLVELMVTLAVMAILMGIAAPAFVDFVRAVRASSTVSALNGALSLARSEAVKRNVRACVYSADWSAGWSVRIDSNSNSSCSDNTDVEIRAFSGISATSTLTVTQGGASVTEVAYLGSGRRASANDVTLAFRSVSGACTANRDRDLTVSNTGRTQVQACSQ